MAHDVCILFMYHKMDSVTRRHLQLIQRHNADVPVVPITYKFNGVLPNSVDLANSPGRWAIGDESSQIWRNLDTLTYTWFEQVRSVHAKRYILLEWDCYCNCHVRRFYKKVWNADLACAQIKSAKDHNWFWHMEFERLGKFQPAARGVVPLAGVMVSEWLLEQISKMTAPDDTERVPLENVFAECRLGTLAKVVGADMVEIPGAKDKFLTAHELLDGPCHGPGIYHQIKQ